LDCSVLTGQLLRLATEKLLDIEDPSQADVVWDRNSQLTPRKMLKHLATLSVRLALRIGADTPAAAELVASHLAVLTGIDDDRTFLRTAYPSEPILAEVSADLTGKYGWASPLKSLCHFIQVGNVEVGWSGELVSKILCLMSVGRALRALHARPTSGNIHGLFQRGHFWIT
jgi:hypothetical protein